MLTLKEKREYLKSKIKYADFIAEISGPNCEVVLRDYHDGESTILHILHGELSGRKVGETISGVRLKKIMRQDWHEHDAVSNYLLVNEKDQKLFRASTLYMKKDGDLAGLLCVNYDLTELMRYRDFVSDKLLYGLHDGPETTGEGSDVQELDLVVEEMIERVFLNWDREIPLTQVELEGNPIRELYQMGVFNHKGAVLRVSELLDLSPQSIYRYTKTIENSLAVTEED